MRVDRLERSGEHRLGLARRDDGVERARDFEAEIGAGLFEVLADGAPLGAGGALERVGTAAGVDRPLQIDPAAIVVRDVGIHELRRTAGNGNEEFVDMIGARVACLQRDVRHLRRVTAGNGKVGRVRARLDLGKPLTVREPLRDGLVERQRRLLNLPRQAEHLQK